MSLTFVLCFRIAVSISNSDEETGEYDDANEAQVGESREESDQNAETKTVEEETKVPELDHPVFEQEPVSLYDPSYPPGGERKRRRTGEPRRIEHAAQRDARHDRRIARARRTRRGGHRFHFDAQRGTRSFRVGDQFRGYRPVARNSRTRPNYPACLAKRPR